MKIIKYAALIGTASLAVYTYIKLKKLIQTIDKELDMEHIQYPDIRIFDEE